MTERHSTSAATLAKPNPPAKPHKDFPLFRHQNGQWAKKVRGKLHYFGTDPDKAMALWLHEKDDLIAGRTPRPYDPNALTVLALCDLFMESREAKVDTGELTRRHFDELKKTGDVVIKHLGRNTPVEQLRPDDFRRLRAHFGKGVGLKSLEGYVAKARAIFNFASKNGLLEINLNKLWGTEFNKPTKNAIEKQRGEKEKLFTVEEITKLLAQAGAQMKAMILLGINGGLGNTDVALIERADIAAGWLTRKRQKTGKKRRIPLWPETLKAIEDALAKRPEPKDETDAAKLFITKYGNAWTPTGRDNPVAKEFLKVAKEAGITGKGKSFYSLRHTFQTIGDETKDFVAVSAIMGHVDQTISAHYREKISDDRLRAVVDHVHGWLYVPKKANSTPRGKRGAK